MRFGGHQTFPLREGWLTKAVDLIETDPAAFLTKELSEHLGVGTNMAKSIEHWLVVTGLASRLGAKDAHRVNRKYVLTPVGQTIYQRDPYFSLEDTWWLLHINTVNDQHNAATWDWFFNDFPEQRFDKTQLVGRLLRHENESSAKPASEKTIERDVSCFLSTYSRPVPREKKDPEEDLGSPFQDLGLISLLRASGSYEIHRRNRAITPEVLLYAILRSGVQGDNAQGTRFDFTFTNLIHHRSGPLQSLVLSTEGLFEALLNAENEAPEYGLAVRGLAGDRQITLKSIDLPTLVERMYRNAT